MKKFLILVVMISIFLASCGNNTGGGGNINANYRTGNTGISMSFLDDNPPSSVFDNSKLNVLVQVTNEGAYDIDGGLIILHGYDNNIINVGKNDIVFNPLEGKSIYNPSKGELKIIEYKDKSISVLGGADAITQSVKATACYKYQTIAVAEVCIDPTRGTGKVVEKTCNVHSVSLSGGQGAPVAVTRIDHEMATSGGKSKAVFKIFVKNVGGGQVFGHLSLLANCHKNLDFSDLNKISVTTSDVFLPGGVTASKCSPSEIRLDNDQGFLICEFNDLAGDTPYISPLTVRLKYNYRQSIQKDIEIVHIPTE